MPDPSLVMLRATIDSLGTDAKVLLLRAQHDAMKAHIRHAQRDLTEALALLNEEQHAKSQALLKSVIGSAIQSARLRLQLVEFVLRNDGPDAAEIANDPGA